MELIFTSIIICGASFISAPFIKLASNQVIKLLRFFFLKKYYLKKVEQGIKKGRYYVAKEYITKIQFLDEKYNSSVYVDLCKKYNIETDEIFNDAKQFRLKFCEDLSPEEIKIMLEQVNQIRNQIEMSISKIDGGIQL